MTTRHAGEVRGFSHVSHSDPGAIEDVAMVCGGHVRLKITRLTPGAPHYIMTVRADEFSLQWTLDTFGGGDYYVRAFDGRRYIQSFRLSMDTTVPATDVR